MAGNTLAGTAQRIFKVLSHAIQTTRRRWKPIQRKIADKLKTRAEKKAYEKALKTETLSNAQILSNAIRLEDLEKQINASLPKDSPFSEVENQGKTPELEKRVGPVPEINLARLKPVKWEVWPFIVFLMGQRAVRWVLMAFFLIAGGYIAKATLAPLLNRTPVNTFQHPAFARYGGLDAQRQFSAL